MCSDLFLTSVSILAVGLSWLALPWLITHPVMGSFPTGQLFTRLYRETETSRRWYGRSLTPDRGSGVVAPSAVCPSHTQRPTLCVAAGDLPTAAALTSILICAVLCQRAKRRGLCWTHAHGYYSFRMTAFLLQLLNAVQNKTSCHGHLHQLLTRSTSSTRTVCVITLKSLTWWIVFNRKLCTWTDGIIKFLLLKTGQHGRRFSINEYMNVLLFCNFTEHIAQLIMS